MKIILLNVLLTGLVSCFAHEGGHYLSAFCFGKRLKFRFEFGKLFGIVPIPRGVWNMPYMEGWKQRVVAVSGFGLEFLCAGVFVALGWLWPLLVASCHIIAYPFYAGDSSDFKWL